MTEEYLLMFEDAIRKQAEVSGMEAAIRQAKKAGLTVSEGGRITSCAGHPITVLLRLIRLFTEDGNLAALIQCTELIREMERVADRLESLETTADA